MEITNDISQNFIDSLNECFAYNPPNFHGFKRARLKDARIDKIKKWLY